MTNPSAPQILPVSAFALPALLCSVVATVLESSAVAVALPAIASDFGVSATLATWVMAASQLVIVALLLPMAALGEVLGYRRVLLASLGLYAAASVVCILAPGFGWVVAGRALQAVGTAGAMSLGFAMLRAIYPDDRLGTAVGLMAATVAIASSAGPALSGVIIALVSWRGVFALLAAVGLLAVLLGSAALPRVPPSGKPYDLPGAAMVAGMLAAALIGINGLANGWSVWILMVAALAFALLLSAVLARSLGTEAPVFPVDLIARPVFSLSVSASICAFVAQTLGFILLPFYLLTGIGMGEMQMALTLSVWPAATALLAPVIGRFSDRLPPGPTGAVGLVLLGFGFALLAGIDAETPPAGIAARLALCGIGFAIFQTPNNRLIMLSAPRARSGAASGMLSVARQFGRAIGTAMAAFALIAGPAASLGAMWAAAAVAALGAVASLGRAWAARKAPV